jgi:transcription elongation GreA/GreB family factor
MQKAQAIDALKQACRQELAAIEQASAAARDETTNAETKQEGKYDTRAIEASYLARGQAVRVASLRQLTSWFEQLQARPCTEIQVGALFQLEGSADWLFMAPVGGSGAALSGQRIKVISPASPLGKALSELESGDEVTLSSPKGQRSVTVSVVL